MAAQKTKRIVMSAWSLLAFPHNTVSAAAPPLSNGKRTVTVQNAERQERNKRKENGQFAEREVS